ncbi:DJ-1/PfpI family protein [Synergistaceae bacterium OttesenSCG-928-D05]|nr:DJ-1/PfpI family protein [Synergistaceae bacterium OttesenSCG-928-D05]
MKKILLFVPKGFEILEFASLVDVMGWAKTECALPVDLTTCGFTKQVKSAFGVEVTVDTLFEEISANDYDALAIPGGFEVFGFYEHVYDERLLDLIRRFDAEKKIIASICVGSLPIAKSGVLKRRRATTFKSDDGLRKGQLRDFGALVQKEHVVVDNNVISSDGPDTAQAVAFKLLELLTSPKDARRVQAAMGFETENAQGDFFVSFFKNNG